MKMLATIIVLMFTNFWSVFRIMEGYWIPKCIKQRWTQFWKRQTDKLKSKLRWLIKDGPVQKKPLEDVMGKSLFKMPHVIVAEQEGNRKELLASGKTVEDDDVAFKAEEALEAKRKFEQVPDEQLDDVFSDTRMEDVAKYSEEEKTDTKADGNSFEDIDKAVTIAKYPLQNKADIAHAGKVFTDMEGNELYEKLTNSPELGKRIRMILALCLEGVNEVTRTAPATKINKKPKVPLNFEDFNVNDFL